MKKTALFLVLVAAVTVALALTPGIAFANFAIHGGYTADTDACAGCHRAHTSVSAVTWSDGTNQHSALLVSSASLMYEFCYACHDNAAQGADTNVEGGMYKGNYYGSHDATLNGGFFGDTNFNQLAITSSHVMDDGSWGAYGGGTDGLRDGAEVGTGIDIQMSCASCHDPHGSSNYRLLADRVAGAVGGVTVGGYDINDDPTPFVISNEAGYPNGTNGNGVGWKKHQPGADQMAGYKPDYTRPHYAKAPDFGTNTGEGGQNDVNRDISQKGMSGWCAGCHTKYMDFGSQDGDVTGVSTYAALDGWGAIPRSRHRHPMNVSMEAGNGEHKTLAATIPVDTMTLPLAHEPSATESMPANVNTDWIDCMTCHVAHGTSVEMTGFANVKIQYKANGELLYEPNTGTGGTQPTGDSALLRLNNRGVCEGCHNK